MKTAGKVAIGLAIGAGVIGAVYLWPRQESDSQPAANGEKEFDSGNYPNEGKVNSIEIGGAPQPVTGNYVIPSARYVDPALGESRVIGVVPGIVIPPRTARATVVHTPSGTVTTNRRTKVDDFEP